MSHSLFAKWNFAADRGGTFTDIVAVAPDGKIHSLKLLTSSPHYSDATIEGIRRILGTTPGPKQVAAIKIGTTLATNTLLERSGQDTVVAITAGFTDLLAIGEQNRPELFALAIQKAPQLYRQVIAVPERLDASGRIIQRLDQPTLRHRLEECYRQGLRSLAIVLLHSWKNPIHERQVQALALEIGFTQITCSYDTLPLIKIVARGRATVVDAYTTPVLHRYLKDLRRHTATIRLQCMQSNGGIVAAELFSGKDAVLSGPAGGVLGLARMAQLAGFSKAIGFDMGGTSTDVSRFDDGYEKAWQTQVAGIEFPTDMLHIETVAAGGGSRLHYDGSKMSVGPDSAGAIPGPACYRQGGPLTITDANLMLGRVVPRFFPQVFGADANLPLEREVVISGFKRLASTISEDSRQQMTPEQVAAGYIRIANQNMGQAIKTVSIARGIELEDYALVCFGGAGAQHACALARSLGIATILLPPLAGVLSAYGILGANVVRSAARSVLRPFTAKVCQEELPARFAELADPLLSEVRSQGIAESRIELRRYLDIRPQGSEAWETIAFADFASMCRQFSAVYRCHYGMSPEETLAWEIVNLRAEAIGKQPEIPQAWVEPIARTIDRNAAIDRDHQAYFTGSYHPTPIFARADLTPGTRLIGPALVVEQYSTIVIEPNFIGEMNGYGHLLLRQNQPERRALHRRSDQADPVLLEIFHNIFSGVAEQMGVSLLKTAHSTNIKERMDFSCAVFAPDGNLVANAPHIPVHLGAMSETVKSILARQSLQPGDVYAANDPFAGGSHLPDITVVTPVFAADRLIFAVASRGHHADIGGITPGSMPPFSRSLSEEGVVFSDLKLVEQGRFQEKAIIDKLSAGAWPVRNIAERLADLRAQIAANQRGCQELHRVIAHYGLTTLHAYMGHIQANAAWEMKLTLGKLLQGQAEWTSNFTDYLDDGARITVTIKIERGANPPASHRATIDFSGSAPQLSGNLNAPYAVTKAAVLYVLRTLIAKAIPLNEGCLEPITIQVAPGTLLNPQPGAAVAGGNVETSQRIVDVLFGALGIMAASQGTMNNLTFGSEGFGYYETICGGAGAGPGFDGADAVHTHMTNTRLTDPEVLEYRYPEVRVSEFALRRGSGGSGEFCGGDGVVRRLHFLQPRTLTVLSERRAIPPYGLNGGRSGDRGLNSVTRNGQEQAVPAKVELKMNPGDTFNIYTPGGGGWGWRR